MLFFFRRVGAHRCGSSASGCRIPGGVRLKNTAMNIRLPVLFLMVACGISFHACSGGVHKSQPQSDVSGYTVTDGLGREVHFRQPPRRIVVAGRALFMIADALYMFPGVSPRIVAMGRTDQSAQEFIARIDPGFRNKVSLPESAGPEQIASLHPDAVILRSDLSRTTGSSLESLSIPVVYVDLETPAQYYRDLQTLGALLHESSRAAALVQYYQAGVQRVRDAVAGLPDHQRQRVLLLYYSQSQGAGTFSIPPDSWMQTTMVEMAGGIPIWKSANPGKGWSQVSLEQIFAWDPDVIFVVSYNAKSSDVVGRLRSDRDWQAVRALKTGRLYAFAGDFHSWDQPDSRWILGLTWMAQRLYPESFNKLDMIAMVRDFYRTAYGQDDAFFENAVRPLLRGETP
jgi:iron complex transport system substrate-binding protein